jgi:hypothetical protein
VLAIYRLYFHPLSRFPGPKLAAITSWYEFYYDVILDGNFYFHKKKLHQKYGMFTIDEFSVKLVQRPRYVANLADRTHNPYPPR